MGELEEWREFRGCLLGYQYDQHEMSADDRDDAQTAICVIVNTMPADHYADGSPRPDVRP